MKRTNVVDTISDFMRGQEWQESVQIFVEANCALFKEDSSKGYTHEQFSVWKNFQEIVESILASALDADAGLTMKDFERGLEELSKEPAAGPREGVKREILSQLLTYADFNDFATMMNLAVTFQYPEQAAPNSSDNALSRVDNRAENKAMLLQLGFPEDATDHVISSSVRDSTLDHLIDQLHNMQRSSEGAPLKLQRDDSGISITIVPDREEAKELHYGNSYSDAEGNVNQESLEIECINAFAQETLQDASELRAKFVIALSILDSVDAGDTSDGILEQLSWASSMCSLFQEIVISFSSGVPFEQYTFTYAKGLLSWFDKLDKTFFSLNIGATTGGMMSEAELRRIVALEDLASMGTKDERLLHGLISRHEEVLKDLSGLHGKCILMTSVTTKGTTIKREHLEELYLYLKQQVNSGSDLSSVSDEMYNQVSQLVSSDVSTDAVNLLLDIHVLEDEQILLKRQIMALIRDPTTSKDDNLDDELQEISLFGNNASAPGAEAKGGHSELKPPKMTAWVSGHGDTDASTINPYGNTKYSLPPLISPGKEYRGIRQEIQDKEMKEDLEAARLAKIREQHRNGLKQLLGHLQDQKARTMRSMERKMARRKSRNNDGSDDVGKNTRNLLEGNIDDPSEETPSFDLNDLTQLEDALVAGYKRRCVHETRLAEKNGGVLNGKLLEEAKENATGELRRKYEEELRKLMEELEHDREKERNRIKDMLFARRQKNRMTDKNGALQAEEERILKESERDFDNKEANTIAEMQRQSCLSLAAVISSQGTDASEESAFDTLCGGHILDVLLEGPSPLKMKKIRVEEDYFDSPSRKGTADPSADDIEQWLFKLKAYANSFGAVGASLVNKAQTASGHSKNGLDPAIPSKVFQVVFNACENQLVDEGGDILSFGRSRKDHNLDAIKARILDEFERSKAKSELDKSLANEDRVKRLQRKRAQKLKANRCGTDDLEIVGDSGDEAEEDVTSVLTSAIDELMDESTQDTLSSVVAVYNQALPIYENAKDNSNFRLRTAEDKSEKEKMVAAEREHKKELTDDLYAQMALRKGNLEERLRQKKAKNLHTTTVESKDSPPGESNTPNDPKDEDEDKLKKLELAFGLVTELVQGAHGDELKKMDLDSLLGLIEHATKGRAGGRGDVMKPASITAASNHYREGYEDILRDIDALIGSRGSGRLEAVDLVSEREQKMRYKEHMDGIMQSKAKNLSSQYNTEKEKYDLRMKIEQARQQQTLQRKLLERRQSNANRPVIATGGAGYSSVAGGNLLAGMMLHADRSKNGASPAKPPIPEATAFKSRGLSTNNLFRK